jgi:hypothetical protein
MTRFPLVRNRDLVEAKPHDEPAQIGIRLAQPQQMVDGRAREELEVAGIDGQANRRAKLNESVGEACRRHLQRVLAVAVRAYGVDDIRALAPSIE